MIGGCTASPRREPRASGEVLETVPLALGSRRGLAVVQGILTMTEPPASITIDSTRWSCSVNDCDASINTTATSAASMAPCVRTDA